MSKNVGIIDNLVLLSPPGAARVWADKYKAGFEQLFKKRAQDISTPVPVEKVVEMMEENGFERAHVIGATMRFSEGRANYEVLAKIIEKYPNKFIGRVICDVRRGMSELKDVERAIRDYGYRSVMLTPYAYEKPPNTNIFYPFFAKCCELDVPVWTQVGHTAPMFPSEVGRPIYLDEVALYFPECKIIGGHIGWPWTDEMISLAWKYPNVYIDLSAHTPKYYPKEIVHFMNSNGQDKVLFATNYPFFTFERIVKEFNELPLKEEAKNKVLRQNNIKLYKLG